MRRLVICCMSMLAGLGLLTPAPASAAPTQAEPPPVTDAAATPTLSVAPLVSGVDHPWDVGFLPDGTMFFTERAGRLWVRLTSGELVLLRTMGSADDFWASGETGLMSVEADPAFASNRRLYTCQGRASDTSVVVKVWTVGGDLRSVAPGYTLVGPIDGSSGRHGGCQLRFDTGGFLRIGTGDAATGTNPQDVGTLAGKTLRVDKATGEGVSGNPFASSGNAFTRKIFTYGHRNVQGLTVQPSTGTVWSVEQGSYRDDEVNVLTAGGNYGWNPVPRNGSDPSYNEGADSPMTDPAIPGAIGAAWSSGDPTIATSAGTFLSGAQWGAWNGALAVMALKDQHMEVMFPSGSTISSTARPAALDHTYGRLRGAEQGPDGALYITTDNGGGNDVILRVAASSTRPFGNLDAVSATPGGAIVEGWAIAPAAGTGAAEVDVYVDGAFAGYGYASAPRPDVNGFGYGPNHGFRFAVGARGGTHDVCAYAIDPAGSINPLIGCRTVTLSSGEPFGNLEAIVRIPGGFSVQGWGIDPDTSAPIEVDVYVDGRFATYGYASGNRPDLGSFGRGPNHGFSIAVGEFEGIHSVCAYGINVGGTINPALGCTTVALSSQPFGSLDGVSVNATTAFVQGWAIDPDTAAAIEVDVLRDGALGGYGYAQNSRPDVAAAYPQWSQRGRGFTIAVPRGGATHTYCAYAINVSIGVNKLLGCTTT